ncbi:hypothetical protein WA538_003060, partial [Blastocystis sp. DL]
MEGDKKERVKGYLESNPEDEKERFLLDYVKNMRWKEEGDDYVPNYNEIVGEEAKKEDLEEDIKDIDQQDRFEHLFNTRFEQDNLVMYPRQIEGSMRRKKDKRKQEREAKRLRQEDERKRREEELRRLRALKRQELETKLKEIQDISGVEDGKVSAINLDEDWDPEKYDKEMEAMFNDDYYEEEEADPLKKPDLHLEEVFEKDELPEEMQQESEEENENEENDDAENENEENDNKEKDDNENEKNENDNNNNDNDEETKAARAEAEKLMDELYQLDYEDMIGSMPVRFHYTQVKPQSYGLSTEEIMDADDKELRQYVSIKKMAPYREREWYVPKNKAGKFKSQLQKKLKKMEEEEKKSRKEEKKNRKKEKKEMEKKAKQEQEQTKSTKRRRKSKK